ncbi:MAG: phosphatidylserine decarboxylase family protein [Gemmatimonadota bacterium]|nr:phosphatidylserine decarboxylase family protein [Gemmatimonadota bacterium]MDH3367015.1 phosphatidylserine decarboxylase family protein [Gemmatimonadota bacterium]MDH3478318.1 phosphatidylserine decarboxylase family protein [Gemmatimonadota bacterium]MDH3570976.1 phosphatidylserine decarboxylase family protein [Gemmatimonadota bacterium]MDH5550254.1 phosphatidylserine decarboxylase family protein [Gemmatimonadota bacterium]
MRLAPEGRPFVVVALIVVTVCIGAGLILGRWWWGLATVAAPIGAWVPWFFRDPDREGPRGDRLALAPADGKVVSVGPIAEPTYHGGEVTRISIFMNVFDVHVNRYPTDGAVTHRSYEPGAFLNATLDKASERNERSSVGVESPHGRVLVRQIAGLVARRIVTDANVGDAARQGERLGIIRFGSRVDTFLPASARVCVKVGDRTRAGVTIIAEWMP